MGWNKHVAERKLCCTSPKEETVVDIDHGDAALSLRLTGPKIRFSKIILSKIRIKLTESDKF